MFLVITAELNSTVCVEFAVRTYLGFLPLSLSQMINFLQPIEKNKLIIIMVLIITMCLGNVLHFALNPIM